MAHTTPCPYCIRSHTRAGATPEEIFVQPKCMPGVPMPTRRWPWHGYNRTGNG
ncbi:MAG: hypothetical protein ACYCVU_00160 [Gammaproteobacteria bacterium]